jgi:CRISPR/Cas system-associated exonuclease Cas4 (RecB family)
MGSESKKPQIIPLILEKVEEEVKAEWRPPRIPGSYRGSELGDCPRYIQLTAMGKERELINPELALLFKDGHLHHDAVRSWLSKTGQLTNVEFSIWKSYQVVLGKETFPITLTGTIDGLYNGEYVLDVKSINPFTFKVLTEEWLKENKVGYIYQLQAYLEMMNKEWGFLIFKDKAFSALKVFWFQRDPEILQKILKKMATITRAIRDGKMMKKPYTKSSKECKWCQMRVHCWGVSAERRQWK